mgnify:CR=1 FL=1
MTGPDWAGPHLELGLELQLGLGPGVAEMQNVDHTHEGPFDVMVRHIKHDA